MALIKKAMKFAREAHKKQKRKYSGIEYFIHPYEVFKILSLVTQDKNILCSGLLHDVIEDTDYEYEDIKKEFSKKIADIIIEVTKGEGKIKTKEGLMVKLADMLSNISDSKDSEYIQKKIEIVAGKPRYSKE